MSEIDYFKLITNKVKATRCKKIEKAAYHEAGHSIVGCYHGFTLNSASIIKEGSSLGRTEFVERINELRICYKKENQMMIRAGVISEYLYCGHWNAIGASQDDCDISKECYYDGGDEKETEKYYTTIFIETYNLLLNKEVWNMINVFAKELIKQKTLTAKDFYRLFPDFKSQVD